ncbi:MAG TPA: hypothetical protein PK697_02865, partial [Candidatus Pacearchaeota archaeon]|nr:hypothetical protein [Candidatus Pacearchaeota archaeon]
MKKYISGIILFYFFVGNISFAQESKVPQIEMLPIQKQENSDYGLASKPLVIGASADNPSYAKISLPEALDYALSHNLDIQGNRINVDIAKNDIKTANRLRNPSLISF